MVYSLFMRAFALASFKSGLAFSPVPVIMEKERFGFHPAGERRDSVKEQKYKKDWTTEISLDRVSGKEKRTAVYQGVWYRYGNADQDRTVRVLWAALPCLAYLALILLYFRLNFPGATVLYVFLPAAVSLFPTLYWSMGAYQVWSAPDRMTRLQKEKGVDRVLRSSAGCAVCALAAAAGDLIGLLAAQAGAGELPGLAMLFTAACVAYASARRFSQMSRSMTEWKEENP